MYSKGYFTYSIDITLLNSPMLNQVSYRNTPVPLFLASSLKATEVNHITA